LGLGRPHAGRGSARAGTSGCAGQGNIAGEIKWSGKHQKEISPPSGLSERAAQATPRPTILIWPETATGSYLSKQPEQAIEMAGFVARDSVPVFSGFADYSIGPDGKLRAYNAAGQFAPGEPHVTSYAKRHLVPFGERMPFQWLIPGLGKLQLGQAEWASGRETVLSPSAAGPFSALICFESIFRRSRAPTCGARWLVNVTNDEWFETGQRFSGTRTWRCSARPSTTCRSRAHNPGLTILVDSYGASRAGSVWTPRCSQGARHGRPAHALHPARRLAACWRGGARAARAQGRAAAPVRPPSSGPTIHQSDTRSARVDTARRPFRRSMPLRTRALTPSVRSVPPSETT
jgi:hypothetical protein